MKKLEEFELEVYWDRYESEMIGNLEPGKRECNAHNPRGKSYYLATEANAVIRELRARIIKDLAIWCKETILFRDLQGTRAARLCDHYERLIREGKI